MAAKRAKTLTPEQLQFALQWIAANSHDPLRDYVILLLSFKGALRAGEIAGLDWEDVTDVLGKVGQPGPHGEAVFTVPSDIAKKGHERLVPLHQALQGALEHLQRQLGPDKTGPHDPVVRGLYADRVQPNALIQYMRRLYAQMGFRGCSSHSGRRTFVTTAVQRTSQHGCSLKDIQDIVGHKDIETTEAYIELSPRIGSLVRSM